MKAKFLRDQDAPFPTGSWTYVQRAEQNERGEKPSDYEPPVEAPIRLHIAIVGAGVGGLATAVALRRDGHDVHVYEDAPALSEVCPLIRLTISAPTAHTIPARRRNPNPPKLPNNNEQMGHGRIPRRKIR